MTKRAFIWDLDGTLLDSYDAILAGLEETYATYQLPFDRASIKDYILKHSVQDLLVAVAMIQVGHIQMILLCHSY